MAQKVQFVRQRGGRFFVGQKPFRFVGANVALMYRDEDRERMPETLRQAHNSGSRWCVFGRSAKVDQTTLSRDRFARLAATSLVSIRTRTVE